MHRMNEEEFEQTKKELYRTNKGIRNLKRRTSAKYRDCLIVELEEAIRLQKHALAHRLTRRLAST